MPLVCIDSTKIAAGLPDEINLPRVERPFKNYPTPDTYARTIRREYLQRMADYTPSTANRTTYTNLLTYSEDFSNAAWTKSNVTVTPSARANPADGLVTMSKLEATDADSAVYRDFTPAIVVDHCFSVWLVADSPLTISLFLIHVGTGSPVAETVCAVTTTPQRFVLSSPNSDTTSHRFAIGGFSTFSAGEIVYAYGAQLELASTPGPYIPTTDSARTISAPDLDTSTDTVVPADPFAYLVEESDPVPNSNQVLVGFSRTYARIPADQVIPSARLINRPVMHDIRSGSTYAVSFDNGRTSWLFTSRKSISSIGTIAAPTKTITGDVDRLGTSLVGGTVARAGIAYVEGEVDRLGNALQVGDVNRDGLVDAEEARAISGTNPTSVGARTTLSSFGTWTITVSGAGGAAAFSNSSSASAIKTVIETAGGAGCAAFVSATPTSIQITWTGGDVDTISSSNTNIIVQGNTGSLNITPATSGTATDTQTVDEDETASIVETVATTDTYDLTETYGHTDTVDTTENYGHTDTVDTDESYADTTTYSLTESYAVPDSARVFGATSHGGAAGDYVAFYNGGRIVAQSIVLATTTHTFSVPMKDVDGKDFAATHCVFSSAASARYVNGPQPCTIRRTQKFYLPGVSAGISDFTDIPIPAPQTDGQSWLAAIVAGDDWAVESVSDVTPWRGPILMVEISEIQMSDALVSVSV